MKEVEGRRQALQREEARRLEEEKQAQKKDVIQRAIYSGTSDFSKLTDEEANDQKYDSWHPLSLHLSRCSNPLIFA
jgi:hypothetical protein